MSRKPGGGGKETKGIKKIKIKKSVMLKGIRDLNLIKIINDPGPLGR